MRRWRRLYHQELPWAGSCLEPWAVQWTRVMQVRLSDITNTLSGTYNSLYVK